MMDKWSSAIADIAETAAVFPDGRDARSDAIPHEDELRHLLSRITKDCQRIGRITRSLKNKLRLAGFDNNVGWLDDPDAPIRYLATQDLTVEVDGLRKRWHSAKPMNYCLKCKHTPLRSYDGDLCGYCRNEKPSPYIEQVGS